MTFPVRRLLPALLLGLILPAVAVAQGLWHQGDLSIRYNVVPATALPAASAQQLGVPHTASQGLLNVLVTRGSGADAPSIAADVSARGTTENGSPVRIRMRVIKDTNGISYLGVFKVANTGKIRFDLDVTPQGATTQHIHFEHTFVVD